MDICRRAIIIPVHIPKIDFLSALLNSISLYSYDKMNYFKIVLLVSNADEMHLFSNILSNHPLLSQIIFLDVTSYARDKLCSEYLVDLIASNRAGSIINIKKFMGLHWSIDSGFEWVVCIDADTLAIKSLSNLFERLQHNHNLSMYIGSRIDTEKHAIIYHSVLEESSKLFIKSDRDHLSEITRNFNLYSWFYDAPIYRSTCLRRFFDYMELHHGSVVGYLAALKWETFDHIVYTLYRTIYDNAVIYDVSERLKIFSRTERFSGVDVYRVYLATGYSPVWMSADIVYSEPNVRTYVQNLSLLMHVDR